MFRFGKRQTDTTDPQSASGVAPTAEDERNIEAYTKKVREILKVLALEITAIKDGELDRVGELFDTKTKLFKWLELRAPLVEPFLGHEVAKRLRLDVLLQELKDSIEEDTLLLSRMASAAKAIVREIEKANERRGLDGLYEQTGKLAEHRPMGKKGFDGAF